MEIAVMAGLFTKWDVDIDACHWAKVVNGLLTAGILTSTFRAGSYFERPFRDKKTKTF